MNNQTKKTDDRMFYRDFLKRLGLKCHPTKKNYLKALHKRLEQMK